MEKISWVGLPLLVYGAYLALSIARGRSPTKYGIMVQSSLLLLVYLLMTAGLGIFWVANQQLPLFDWHYLFGYATLLLVGVHLWFTLPLAIRYLRSRSRSANAPAPRASALGKGLAIACALGISFYLGMRHGSSELRFEGGGPTAESAVGVVVRYHEHASASRSEAFARAPSIEWGDRPAAFKTYGDDALAVPLPLPTQSPSRGMSQALRATTPSEAAHSLSQEGLSPEGLSTLLHHAAGITLERPGTSLRASPSSGALFPTELYVVVREVDGVERGIYHYDPAQHRLVRLTEETRSPRELGGFEETRSPATILVTSIFRRTGFKYRNRAYRYAVADAGHLIENLRIAAAERGLAMHPLLAFDEQHAAELIGVDDVEEGVLAVLHLAREAVQPMHVGPRFIAAPLPEGPTVLGVTGAVHRATSLRRVDRRIPVGQRIALPAGGQAAASALATIADRRSQRRYADQPVALTTLAGILADASRSPLFSPAVSIDFIANRVSGLPSGAYRYLPGPHEVVQRSSGDLAAEAQSAGLSQDVIGDAAVVFLLTADRELALTEGARGYRHVFLEAGLVGERLMLSAVARDLGFCPVGAFYDDEATALLGEDPERSWVLHFGALGHVE